MLFFAKFLWAELNGGPTERFEHESVAAQIQGMLIIDAKALYDGIEARETVASQMSEKRTGLEVASLREALAEQNTLLRWVHSEANLADSLTKPQARAKIMTFLRRRRWRVVFDPMFVSAKKRSKLGKAPLDFLEDVCYSALLPYI